MLTPQSYFEQNNITFHLLLHFRNFHTVDFFLFSSFFFAFEMQQGFIVVSQLFACIFYALLLRPDPGLTLSQPTEGTIFRLKALLELSSSSLFFSGLVFKPDKIGAEIAAGCSRIRMSRTAPKV